jgi:hypothetical protein
MTYLPHLFMLVSGDFSWTPKKGRDKRVVFRQSRHLGEVYDERDAGNSVVCGYGVSNYRGCVCQENRRG